MNKSIDEYIAYVDLPLVEAMKKIDKGSQGILFIVNKKDELVGCVTDGDIRRWLIKTADLNAIVSDFMQTHPKYAMVSDNTNLKERMARESISAIPIVDENTHIVAISFRNGKAKVCSIKDKALSGVPVVIMAGGKGTRLYPYTKILPKPLIPIGDIPIIERIINGFVQFGANDFYITVNYKKGMIKSYFDDLEHSYSITYVNEDKPLGTGGSISLINKKFDRSVIIANCDSLIRADLADIYGQHISSGNKITVVSSLKNITIPYGVLNIKENGILTSVSEKPSMSYLINTGMYIVDQDMLDMIPKDTFYHMTQLLDDAIGAGMQVGVYPISEDTFLDMGEFSELRRMEEILNVQGDR